MQAMGVETIIYTDIKKDGMLSGPNHKATGELVRSLGIPVVASGGVTTLRDIEQLRKLEGKGLEGAIVGKALYSGALDLKAAIAAAQPPKRKAPARPGRKTRRIAATARRRKKA
jgi:phosphoribosylformimino-5-aminoimidazole carboxamide ribotide isomerase